LNFPQLKVFPKECGIGDSVHISLLKGYGKLLLDCIGKKNIVSFMC